MNIQRLIVLIALVASMVTLQLSSATVVKQPIPAGGMVIVLKGWPVAAYRAFASPSVGGGVKYENVRVFGGQLAVDVGVSILVLTLCYMGLVHGVVENRFRLSLNDLFFITLGVVLTILYFQWNHDICVWGNRIYLGPPNARLAFEHPVLNRPMWQTCLVAFFLATATSTLFCWVARRLTPPAKKAEGAD